MAKSTTRRYRKAWESEPEFLDWLSAITEDDTKAFCKLCRCTLQAHKKDLHNHGKCKKHLEAFKFAQAGSSSIKVTSFFNKQIAESRKIAELKIAAFISEHCSISVVDHLGAILKDLDEYSKVLSDVKLHRTKCTALIKNVISPCMLQDLITDIGESFFSMIVDESTAVDATKMLCIMIRYFSVSKQNIRTEFYRIIPIIVGDATTLAETFKSQLVEDGLDIKKLIGIGVHGANVMIGRNHSFSSILRSTNENLVVIKCVSHSLHLAAEYACKALPRNLDFIVKESHNWFSNSTKRQLEYRTLYEAITDRRPLKIDKLSGTRWLARSEAIVKILEQWDALQLHFQISKDKERCYMADQLAMMFCSKVNKLYLTFLSYILKSITEVNKMFQSDNADPLKLLQELHFLLFGYLRMIIPPDILEKVSKKDLSSFKFRDYVMRSECIHFGYSFHISSTEVNQQELKLIKERCSVFLIILCEQLQCRIPLNIVWLEKLCMLSPVTAVCQMKADISDIVVKFKNVVGVGSIDSTIDEWNLIHLHQWSQLNTAEQFWAEVSIKKNAAGSLQFGNISKLVLSLLSLPFSNASVERAFSTLNCVKNKLRNRLAVETADKIMRVRFSMRPHGCTNFIPTKHMLQKFNSEELYKSNLQEDDDVLQAFSSI